MLTAFMYLTKPEPAAVICAMQQQRLSRRRIMGKRRSNRSQHDDTSWDGIADWYDGWAGAGSDLQRELAIPTTMELLELKHGECLLDIGCGPATLYPVVRDAGVRYVGVDLSPRMVGLARERIGQRTQNLELRTANQGTREPGNRSGTKRSPGEIRPRKDPVAAQHAAPGQIQNDRVLLADARKLAAYSELQKSSFDAVVFLLSIQNIDALDAALASAAWALRPGERLVLLMVHPCFRIQRQSGWGWDAGRKLRYRRVDRYLTPLAIPLRPPTSGRGAPVYSFHRPLSDYVASLARCGLLIDMLCEVAPDNDERAEAEFPLFLGLRARKMT
jgi:SAM-dependent methyltransferase